MVVAGVKGQQAHVDVLDLRTWRWRDGIAQLQRPGVDARGVSVVAYETKVLALGGEEDRAFQQQQQQVEDAVRAVWSYDPAANTWSSDGIAPLPFGISRASPVVARMSA
jgi:N-acetylneuraminic acid mutarotase